MSQELIELQKEETEQMIKKLEQARIKLNSKQTLCESDFSEEDNRDWINLNNKFIEEKLSIAYSLEEEETDSLRFYEEEGFKVFSYEKPSLTPQEEDYIIESGLEDLRLKRAGEEI